MVATRGRDAPSQGTPFSLTCQSGYLIETQDAMDVFDPQTKRSSRYHKYFPRAKAHYSRDALERLRTRWIVVDQSEIPDSEADGDANPDSSPDMSFRSEGQRYVDSVRCGPLNTQIALQC